MLPGASLAAALGTLAAIALLTVASWPVDAGSDAAAAERGGETPFWLSRLTPLPERRTREPEPIRLEYQVSWTHLLAAGRIELRFTPPGGAGAGLWQATAAARTVGAARALFPFSGHSRSVIHARTLVPARFQYRQTERGAQTAYEAEYSGTSMRVQSTESRQGQSAPSRVTHRYELPGIRDLLSAVLFLREVELSMGRTVTVLVQPTDRLYLVSLRVVGKERRKVLRQTFDTVRLDVGIRRVNDDLSLGRYSKMRSATFWMDTATQLPVEMRVELPIGFVSARRE
jgi:hypothetical protein